MVRLSKNSNGLIQNFKKFVLFWSTVWVYYSTINGRARDVSKLQTANNCSCNTSTVCYNLLVSYFWYLEKLKLLPASLIKYYVDSYSERWEETRKNKRLFNSLTRPYLAVRLVFVFKFTELTSAQWKGHRWKTYHINVSIPYWSISSAS